MPPILAYLASLANTVNDYPALLVISSSFDGEPSTPYWRTALYAASPTTIDLGPLRNAESLELAQHIAGTDNQFVHHCVEHAGGNPLFLEQLLRIGEHQENMPDSIQSIVWSRLQQLSEMDKKAAQTAAVLGERFSLPTLCFLLDDPHYNCDALVKHYLMRLEGESYRFTHALLQEAVYASLAKPQRLALHRRAAAWFHDRDVVFYAQHLERAEDPAAAKAYLDAARRQIQVYRSVQALDLVQRGLLLSHDPDSEYELTCLHGELLRESGSMDAAIDEFQHALNLSSDNLRQCRAHIGIAQGFFSQGHHDEVLAMLEQAETHLQRQNSPKDLAQIYHLRGKALFLLKRIDDCLKAHEQAQKLAEQAGYKTLEAQSLSGLGNAYYQQGQTITAHNCFHRCVQLCREHSLVRIEAANLIMRSLTHFSQNRLDNALQDALEAVDLATKISHQHDEKLAREILGILQSHHGDKQATQQQLTQSLVLARQRESKHL